MTNDLHHTLTEATRTRATLEHETREIQEKLDDIRDWYPQLASIMTSTPGYAMDLTGIRGTTQRIPGGDALAMLAPYSIGYDEPDNLPHPAQIIHEWADRWREATRTPTRPGEKWASHLAILRANTAWYIRMDASGTFRSDIRALWGRLRALTGNHDKETPPHRGPEDLQNEAPNIPDCTMLTLRQADQCAPGIENRVKRDRNAERDRARRDKREPNYRCNPNGKHWNVGDLRRHYGFPTLATETNIM